MTANCRSSAKEQLPLFLITLPRTAKSQDIFALSSLCRIAIKVEPYKTQNALTQCYNCQKFDHVRALLVMSGQPPVQGLWRAREHFFSTDMLKCQLTVGETAHPYNYRAVGMQRRGMKKEFPKSQRMLSLKFTTPAMWLAEALWRNQNKRSDHIYARIQ
jgi:hypothetical protein